MRLTVFVAFVAGFPARWRAFYAVRPTSARLFTTPVRSDSPTASPTSLIAPRASLIATCATFLQRLLPLLQPVLSSLHHLLCSNTCCNEASTPCNYATTHHPKPITSRESPVTAPYPTFHPTFSPSTPLSTLLPLRPSRYASPRHCSSIARALSAYGDSICSKISSAASM